MSYRLDLSVSVDLEKDINKTVRSNALQIVRGVIVKTPVDTGRAKGNWQAQASNPIDEVTNRKTPVGTAAVNTAAKNIGQARLIEYPTIYITNNLPYIESLDRGSSTQAPAGFIDATIRQVLNGS